MIAAAHRRDGIVATRHRVRGDRLPSWSITTAAMLSPSRNRPRAGRRPPHEALDHRQVDERGCRARPSCCDRCIAMAPPMIDAAPASAATRATHADELAAPTPAGRREATQARREPEQRDEDACSSDHDERDHGQGDERAARGAPVLGAVPS